MGKNNSLVRASLFVDDMRWLMERMVEIDAAHGEIWKWPDAQSCFRYAITEAAEYLEAYLLTNRPNDSRNNKKVEDYNAQTELFDITMMIMRGYMSLYKELNIVSNIGDAVSYIADDIDSYIENNLSQFNELNIGPALPEILVRDVSLLAVDAIDEIVIRRLTGVIINLLVQIYQRDDFRILQDENYRSIATKKLSKIVEKSIKRMAERQAE